MVQARVVLVLTALFLLAGCASELVPNLRSNIVPAGAPSRGGAGSHELTIHVEDPWGTPMPQAPVVAYWQAPCDHSPCPRTLQYVRLRTDAKGQAVVHSPQSQNVSVVASAPGHTEEWALDRSGTGDVTLHVFPPTANATFPLQWNTATATLNGPVPACQLMDFSLGGEATPAEWIRHTVEADITVRWENGLDGIADLKMYYDPPPGWFEFRLSGCPGDLSPEPTALLPGPHSDTMHISKQQMEQSFAGAESIPQHLYVGPVARGPAIGVALPYTITIDAKLERYPFGDQIKHYDGFSTQEIRSGADGKPTTEPYDAQTGRTSPGAGLLVVAVALVGAALRRRGD